MITHFKLNGSWRVVTWEPNEVRITGLHRGWGGLFAAVALPTAMLFSFVLAFPLVAAVLITIWSAICFGSRFEVKLSPEETRIRLRWYFWDFDDVMLPTERMWVELVDDWDDELAGVFLGGAEGGQTLGDLWNSPALFDVLRAAQAEVLGHHARGRALLLSSPDVPLPSAPGDQRSTARDIAEDRIRPFIGMDWPLLFAEGWTRHEEGTMEALGVRTGIFVLRDERAKLIFDGYLTPTDLKLTQVRAARGTRVFKGSWDENALSARRHLVWSSAPFRLYERGRRVAGVAGNRVELHDASFARSEISHVESWVAEDWSRINVRIMLRRGGHRVVAQRLNLGILNVFYDGWDLEFDTIWAESMAAALADDLAVEWRRAGY